MHAFKNDKVNCHFVTTAYTEILLFNFWTIHFRNTKTLGSLFLKQWVNQQRIYFNVMNSSINDCTIFINYGLLITLFYEPDRIILTTNEVQSGSNKTSLITILDIITQSSWLIYDLPLQIVMMEYLHYSRLSCVL